MYPQIIEQLIEKLVKLPGIGRRGAERIVFWMLDHPQTQIFDLADNIKAVKEQLKFCPKTNNLTENDFCRIYSDPGRDKKSICIVETPKDLMALEKTGLFKGIYYVLLQTISPSEGKGPEELNLSKLFNLINESAATEVIIATDADTEGEMTALHLAKELESKNIKVSRIGVGLPAGGSIEFADLSTISMSLNSRKEMNIS